MLFRNFSPNWIATDANSYYEMHLTADELVEEMKKYK